MKTSLRSIIGSNIQSGTSLKQRSSASIFCVPAKQFKTLFIFFSFLLFAFWANANTYYLTAAGAANAQTPASWNTVAGGGGTAAADFVTNGDIFNIPVVISGTFGANTIFGSGASSGSGVTIQVLGSITINNGVTITLNGKNGNNTSMTVTGTIIFGATSKVSLNDNDSRNSFTLLANATFKTSNILGVVGANCSIEKTIGVNSTVTLTNGANYEFNGTALQATLGLPTTAATINTLIINNSAGVSLTAAVTVTALIIGNVTANSILNDNGKQITSAGTFTLTSGTFNIGTGSTATTWPGFTAVNTNIAIGATVNYNSTASQTIAAVNYYNLSNTANGPRTLPGTGTVGIAGNFSPGSGAYTVTTGSTVSFNGTAAQTIPAVGFSFFNLSIDNTGAGVTISNNITASNSLALNNGVLTTTTSFKVIALNSVSRTNGWVNGTLQRHIVSAALSYTFYVGDATNYSPVLINYATTSFVAGDLAITPTALQHPALATSGISTTKYVKRYWTLAGSGGLSGTYDASFNFVAGDIQGLANTASFIVRDYSSSVWGITTTGALTATSTQALSLTGFGDFSVGESTGLPTVFTHPSAVAICAGTNTFFTSTSSSTPAPTVFWQRSTNGTLWNNIIAGTDGGIYSNFTTTTLNITGATAAVTGYFYRAVFTNINGSVNSNSAQLTVTQPPTITSLFYSPSTMATIITTPQAVTLTGTNAYTGGTFSATPGGLIINSSTGAITPNGSSLGAYTVTYTIAAAGGCSLVSASTPVSITSASISYSGAPYCSSDNSSHTVTYTNTSADASAAFSALPAGLSINATTGNILPSTSTPNTYTVTYSKTGAGAFTLSTTVKITALPTAAISYTGAPFCNSDIAPKTVTLTGTGAYSGGGFSSDAQLVLNTGNGSFTPNGSSVGSHTIIYTIPATGGCASIPVTTTFSIVAAPTATISYAGSPYCLVYTTATPTVTGASGGTFSSTAGLTFTNTSTGEINPSGSTPGTYTVTYTIPASGSCGTVQIQTTVTIAANPTGSINYPTQPYCTADGPKTVNLTGTGNYTGGIFSSTAGLTINSTTGTVTPSSTTPNTYTVSYAPPGCPISPFTTFVEVDAAPSASISYGGTTSFCIADGSPYTVTISGNNTGIFSSTPTGLGIDPATGTITPSTTTSAGPYNVVYTIAKTGNCGPVVVTLPITVTAIVGTPSISISSGTEPACQLTNGTTTTTYAATAAGNTGLTWSINNPSAGTISAGGVMTWANGFSGTVNIQVSASGCGGPSSNFRAVTISPSVTTPVFTLGATSTRCQGAGIVTYVAAANNTTGIAYSLDVTSVGGGNSIVSTTGDVTFAAGWSGTSVITASAAGCNGPLTAIHTVTITPTVGTPVFSLGATSTRCQGAGTVTYTATATNTTGITYTLDATSLGAGNTIVSTTGAVTYVAVWSGSSTITASAAGCNTSPTTNHTVTVTPTVTINAFSPATSTRCQGAGTITTTTTATNSTGITYSLDAASISGGNTIAPATGAVTYAATWSGTTTITASAAGCNGPATTAFVVTINATSVGGSIAPTLIPVCSGGTTGTMTLSGNVGTVIRWEKSLDAGTTWTTIANTLTTYSTTVTQPTLFRAVVQNGVGICALAYSAAAQVIIDAPFTPTITASANPICIGGSITLTASGYTNSGLVISGGDFANANPPGWNGASANNSNGDPNSGWGEANGPKAWNGVTYNSNPDKFMIVNGTGTPGNTSLTTPVFSLVGLSSAYLAFNQAYNLATGALAQIQISLDGGLTYPTTLVTYTGLVAAPGTFFGNTTNFGVDPKVFINLNAYLGMTNLMVKFLYSPQAGSNWAIDNIVVTNTPTNPSGIGVYNSVTYTWAPAANLSSTSGQSVTFNSVTSGAGSFPYTVTTTTSAAGCVSAIPGTVTVIVNPLPTITTTGTLTAVCFNAVTQTTTLPYTATTGTPTSYSIVWTGLANQGNTAFAFAAGGGTLTGIVIPAGTAAGTYTGTMTITTANGCIKTQTLSVTVNGLPTITSTGIAAAVCFNAGVQTTTMPYTATTNSPTSYSIVWTGLANQSSTAFAFAAGGGTLTGIVIPAGTAAGTYTGTMTISNGNGCTNTQAITVKVNALPTPFNVTGGGNYCSGSTGLVVGLNGSQFGVNYQLQLGGVNTGSAIAGTGASISFGLQTVAGTYTVIATNTTTTCAVAMVGSVTISINPLPGSFNVTGGGNYCAGGTGVVVGLDGSQSGVNYQLQIGGVNTGSTVAGTGSAISFGLKTSSGTYTVVATNATTLCTIAMNGSVTIVINPLPTVTVSSSNICGGAAATITATPGIAGTYSYAWTVPATATNPGSVATFTTLVTGSYSVVITNSNGCVSVSSATTSTTISAVSNSWTGAVSTNWSNVGNWSCGAIPTTVTDVIIPSGVTNMPQLTATSVTKSLLLQPNTVIDLNGQDFTNYGAVTGTGTFKGSAASNLTINAAAAASSINFDQTTDGATNALNNLTINGSGATVTLTNKANLYGTLAPTAGTFTINDILVLRSTSSGTARVAEVTGTIAYGASGKVEVERYYPPLRAWRLVTSPLSTTGNIFDSWQNSGNYVAGKGMFVSGPNPTGIGGNGLDFSTQNNYSMKGWDATGAKFLNIGDTKLQLLSTNASTAASIGYFTFVRGDRSRSPDNTVIPNTNPTTLSSKGKLMTGTQTFSVNVADGGFELIGNPYASPIDFNKLIATNLVRRFYVWDPHLNLVGGYVVMEDLGVTGTYTATPNNSGGLPNNFIQSSEAFFVQKSNLGTSASLSFNEPNKSNSNNLNMFRPMIPKNQVQSLRTNLYTLNNDRTTKIVDGNLAEFSDDFHAEIDLQDALKFGNVNETLGILNGTTSLAVNRRPPLNKDDTIFYKFTRARQLKYQFEFIADNIEQDNLAGFVEDKFLNTSTPLNMNTSTKLDFEVTSTVGSAAADRFRIVFKPSVVYTSLTATVLNSDIGVEWNVANELNIKEYEIERSTDGVHFAKVSTRASSGSSATAVGYNWLDVAPALGYYYYKIRSISNNNVIGYSNMVKVKINKSAPAIYVFPNPVTENTIHLQMNGMAKGVYHVNLMNDIGQVVSTNWIGHLGGTATETIQPTNKLLSGIYQLQVTAPDKKTTMIKVIVQ